MDNSVSIPTYFCERFICVNSKISRIEIVENMLNFDISFYKYIKKIRKLFARNGSTRNKVSWKISWFTMFETLCSQCNL